MDRSAACIGRDMTRALLLCVLSCLPGWAPRLAAYGDAQNLIPELRLDQDAINAGEVPFETLFHTGMHFYTNRFTPADHYGEAPDGPRMSHQAFPGRPALRFLRFNGLDAQTCLECHALAGMASRPEAGSPLMQFPRDPGVPGSAGLAANVFVLENFPASTAGFIRNPPHNFGLGYVQRLAEEMSLALMSQRDAALAEAADAGATVTVALSAKGISFGTLAAGPDGQLNLEGLEGVSEDLVIRPFQFKGIASTLRSFVANAMNFHFSVQARELLDRGVIPNDNPNGTLPDDPRDELLEGDVTAVATFVAFVRPPVEMIEPQYALQAMQGRVVFEQVGCIECHVPELTIDDPNLTIEDPREQLKAYKALRQKGLAAEPPAVPALVNPEPDGSILPVVLLYEQRRAALAAGKSQPAGLPGYTRNLNLNDGPAETRPRLPHAEDGSIRVPLFSDLKRHKMGADLADTLAQGTDSPGVAVPGDEFVTRPLWGVADTGPWLHDGRALTLTDAILMHKGPGSEANEVIENFENLEQDAKDLLHKFLLSLRTPPLEAPDGNAAEAWRGY